MTRELIVHIGSHKTGTTTLQRTFAANKDHLLKEHNVGYLHAPKAEHMHAYMGFDPTRGMVPHGFRFVELDAMVAMLKGATAERTVVSSENFSFVFDPDQIQRLHDRLAGHFDRIWIVAYLRRQDSHMVSHHQEGAKPRRLAEELLFGSDPLALPHYKPHFDLYLDYATRLGKWQKAFGVENVAARVFERDALRDGDIVSDFLGLMDLPADAVTRIDDQNTASGFVRAKVGHLVNTSMEVEEVKAFIVNRLPNDGRLLPARATAQAFYAHFADSNRRLGDMFDLGSQAEVFNQDFSNYPDEAGDLWTEDSANAALASVLESVELLLQGITTNDLRDAAIAAERSNNKHLARRLMTAAYRLRPSGTLIKQKLKAYGVTL